MTSRDRLAGLVALHGARRLTLDRLPAADAMRLLGDLIGDRVADQPDAAAELVAQCARLPLALRVAAELAAAHPTVALSLLVEELADHQRRLDLLDAGGDPRGAVTAVFSWSVRRLASDGARLFRLLGLHPAADFDVHAAAALVDGGVDQSRRTLELLVRAHLVYRTGAGRYDLHDLLRAYAAGVAVAEEAGPERQAALRRLFDYYLGTAAAAMDRLHPAERHRRPQVSRAATPSVALTTPDAALAWLDGERATLIAVAAHTADHGWPEYAVRLPATLFRYLGNGHYADGLALHGHALRAARLAGDLAGEAQARHDIGTIHGQLGGHEQAADQLGQALRLFRQAGDRVGQARALANLGSVEHWLGRYGPAADRIRQALRLFRQTGDRVGQAWALTNLGLLDERLGRPAQAADRLRQALGLYRQVGDHAGEAQTLTGIGGIETRHGQHQPAADHFRQALALCREFGNQAGEAWALTGLGHATTLAGRPDQAAEHHHRALTLFRGAGDPDGEAWALNGLGEAAHASGRPADAIGWHTTAADTGGPDQQARAQTGLGLACRALGDPASARTHFEHALALYIALDAPEADQVRAQLLDPATHPEPADVLGRTSHPNPDGCRPVAN